MTFDDFCRLDRFTLLGHVFYVTRCLSDKTGELIWACPVYEAGDETPSYDEEFLLPKVFWPHCRAVNTNDDTAK